MKKKIIGNTSSANDSLINQIRQKIITDIFIDSEGYYNYWKNLTDFRNDYAVHYSRKLKPAVPIFNSGLEAIYILIDALSNEYNLIGFTSVSAKKFYKKCYKMTIDLF